MKNILSFRAINIVQSFPFVRWELHPALFVFASFLNLLRRPSSYIKRKGPGMFLEPSLVIREGGEALLFKHFRHSEPGEFPVH